MIGIYRIYHQQSGRSYVGKSVNIRKRAKAHFLPKDTGCYISKSISKHGKNAFAWEVLELCSEDNLEIREAHWIAALDCMVPHGYNLTPGDSHSRHTVETRRKISEAHQGKRKSESHRRNLAKAQKGKRLSKAQCEKMSEMFSGAGNPFYGKKHTAETRQKIAEHNKKRVVSEETRQKLSMSRKGKKRPVETCRKISAAKFGKKNPFYGKKHTAETRQKMSDALKGRTLSEEHRKKIRRTHQERHRNKSQLLLFENLNPKK